MKIDAGTLSYLHDVLGLRTILRPMKETSISNKTSESSWRMVGEEPRCLAWLTSAPTAEETELLNKMMGAIGVESYVMYWGQNSKELSVFSFLSFGVRFLKEPFEGFETYGSIQFLSADHLSSMLEGSKTDIQRHKKAAWEKLQQLKSHLNTGDRV